MKFSLYFHINQLHNMSIKLTNWKKLCEKQNYFQKKKVYKKICEVFQRLFENLFKNNILSC